jgi:hypothetical protein
LAYCSNKVGTLKGTKVSVCRHHCQMLPVFVKQQHTVQHIFNIVVVITCLSGWISTNKAHTSSSYR